MGKKSSSVGNQVPSVASTATPLAFIELSYEDLKEISKALSKVNKALDKEKQRLVLGSYVFYKQKIVGEVIDALASSNGKLAGLVTMPLKELVLSDDFSSFKRELKDQIACYKNECRDPEQPLITFYALNGKKVRSKLETWIPKLFAIESWWTLHLCRCQNSTYIQVLFFVFLNYLTFP